MHRELLDYGPQVFFGPDMVAEAPAVKEKIHREALDNLPFGVVLLDDHYNIAHANAATLRIQDSASEQEAGFSLVRSVIKANPWEFKKLLSKERDFFEVGSSNKGQTDRFLVRALYDELGKQYILAVQQDVTYQTESYEIVRHDIKNPISALNTRADLARRAMVGLDERIGNLGSLAANISNGAMWISASLLENLTYPESRNNLGVNLENFFESTDPERSILNNLPLGVAILDNEGYPVLLNPYFQRFSGFDPVRFSFSKVPSMVAGSDLDWYEALVAGEVASHDRVHIYKDSQGQTRYIRFTFVKGNEGQLIAISEDITTEALNINRLRELTLRNLDPLQRLVDQLVERVRELDNNPESRLRGHSDKLPVAMSNLWRRVSTGLAYPVEMDNFKKEPVKINKLLEEALKERETDLLQYGIRLVTALEDVPQINAVHSELVEAFVNLITNASHAMSDPHHEVKELRVACNALPQDPRRIQIEISDTGVGIPKEYQHKIWQHGWSSKKGTDLNGEGSGMTQVARTIKNHDAVIYVKSVTRKEIAKNPELYPEGARPGTIFTIQLHAGL